MTRFHDEKNSSVVPMPGGITSQEFLFFSFSAKAEPRCNFNFQGGLIWKIKPELVRACNFKKGNEKRMIKSAGCETIILLLYYIVLSDLTREFLKRSSHLLLQKLKINQSMCFEYSIVAICVVRAEIFPNDIVISTNCYWMNGWMMDPTKIKYQKTKTRPYNYKVRRRYT